VKKISGRDGGACCARFFYWHYTGESFRTFRLENSLAKP